MEQRAVVAAVEGGSGRTPRAKAPSSSATERSASVRGRLALDCMPHDRTGRFGTLQGVRFFICPNCTTRALDDDGKAGLTHQPVGCDKCGFGYLFELLEDFFPPAGAGMVTCDRDGRVLSCGRGVFELTGYSEREVMGKPLGDAFGLSGFTNGDNPIPVVLEWGVRKLDQHVTLRHHSGRPKRVRVDLFPAYDEDGGLLASLAPEMNGAGTG